MIEMFHSSLTPTILAHSRSQSTTHTHTDRHRAHTKPRIWMTNTFPAALTAHFNPCRSGLRVPFKPRHSHRNSCYTLTRTPFSPNTRPCTYMYSIQHSLQSPRTHVIALAFIRTTEGAVCLLECASHPPRDDSRR